MKKQFSFERFYIKCLCKMTRQHLSVELATHLQQYSNSSKIFSHFDFIIFGPWFCSLHIWCFLNVAIYVLMYCDFDKFNMRFGLFGPVFCSQALPFSWHMKISASKVVKILRFKVLEPQKMICNQTSAWKFPGKMCHLSVL